MTKISIRLLAVGVYQDSMGMGRVMRQMAERLGRNYELHYLALGCPSFEPFKKDGIYYYPVSIPNMRCAHYAAILVRKLDPAIVLLSVEPIWLPSYVSALHRFRERNRLVGYLPIEGRFKDSQMATWLAGLNCAVVFTQYSEQQVQQIFQNDQAIDLPARTAVIPHGVDRQHFFSLAGGFSQNQSDEARLAAKQKAFPGRPELHEGFLVLNANLPYERKRLDLTIEGFACFARDKPANVRLCLHHSRRNDERRAQLESQIAHVGIQERVVFSPVNESGGALSLEQLNILYNACEVGINTAMGEGWGLTSFEHAATGAAQIVPAHTTFLENWSGKAELIEVVDTFSAIYPPFEMDVVSSDSVADCLERLYASETYRLELAERSYLHVHSDKFDWERITEQWDELFTELTSIDDRAIIDTHNIHEI